MTNNTDEKTKVMKEIRSYLEAKYGSEYMSAIAKLNSPNQYDNNGLLRPELSLTPKEKKALMFYIPEISNKFKNFNVGIEYFDKDDISEKKYQTEIESKTSKTFEERYQIFLDDVRKTTIETASKQKMPTNSTINIPWDVVGIEFTSWEIEEKYGKDVYAKACKEVPYEKIPKGEGEFYRMFDRDFSKANKRLGHIIQEGISASPLMDLDLFVEELEKKGIPSYIDYKTKTFYYNSVPTKGKTK